MGGATEHTMGKDYKSRFKNNTNLLGAIFWYVGIAAVAVSIAGCYLPYLITDYNEVYIYMRDMDGLYTAILTAIFFIVFVIKPKLSAVPTLLEAIIVIANVVIYAQEEECRFGLAFYLLLLGLLLKILAGLFARVPVSVRKVLRIK